MVPNVLVVTRYGGAWLPRTVSRLNIDFVSNFRNFMSGMDGAGHGL